LAWASCRATAPNSWNDWPGTLTALIGAAIPFFLTASLLMYVFALHLRWLPASGYVPIYVDPIGSVKSTLMRALTLTLCLGLAEVLQQCRGAAAAVRDHRARKGMHERFVLFRHAPRNAMFRC
jgi:peptide/nickel transport system permease protein